MKPTFAQSIRSQLEARGPLGAALLSGTALGGPASKPARKCGVRYDAARLIACWQAQGLPLPHVEFKFAEKRKWRFDFAFPNYTREILDEKGAAAAIAEMPDASGGLAIEVQGGIWTGGRHTRGAALKKEWEKLNTAASLGWRILYCEPKDVMSPKFIGQIKLALGQD